MSEQSDRELFSAYERLLHEELQRLVATLERIGAEKIILFGSMARGTVNIFSGLDLIVVMDSQADFVERHMGKCTRRFALRWTLIFWSTRQRNLLACKTIHSCNGP